MKLKGQVKEGFQLLHLDLQCEGVRVCSGVTGYAAFLDVSGREEQENLIVTLINTI